MTFARCTWREDRSGRHQENRSPREEDLLWLGHCWRHRTLRFRQQRRDVARDQRVPQTDYRGLRLEPQRLHRSHHGGHTARRVLLHSDRAGHRPLWPPVGSRHWFCNSWCTAHIHGRHLHALAPLHVASAGKGHRDGSHRTHSHIGRPQMVRLQAWNGGCSQRHR